MSHLIKQLLLSNAYWVLNKEIVKTLGLEPAFILGVFADGESTLADENGWFYQTSSTITELTGMTNHKQSQAISKLIEIGVLSQENRGIPCKRYFKINYENLEKLVLKNFENCSSKNLNTSIQKISNNKESIIKKVNKESIDISSIAFSEFVKEYAEIVTNATGVAKNIVEQSIFNNMMTLKQYDCELLLKKIKESDFLIGKLERKPNVANFSRKAMIDRIMADEYKNNTSKKENNKVEVNTKDEFFNWYASKVTVLNIAYNKGKFTGEQKEWAEEILRKEGRI